MKTPFPPDYEPPYLSPSELNERLPEEIGDVVHCGNGTEPFRSLMAFGEVVASQKFSNYHAYLVVWNGLMYQTIENDEPASNAVGRVDNRSRGYETLENGNIEIYF